MERQLMSSASSALPPVGWRGRPLFMGMALAIMLYVLGSLLGGGVIRVTSWQESPMVAGVLALVQLGMALPPLVVMARYGPVARLLRLDRFGWRALVETVMTLGLAFCGMMVYGLVLLPLGIRAQEPVVPLFGDGIQAFASAFLVGAVLAPVIEEIVFRGFLFSGLRNHGSVTMATLGSAALFGALHLQPYAFPVLFLLGVLLALLYQRTGSLWAPILMHLVINAVAVTGQFIAMREGLI